MREVYFDINKQGYMDDCISFIKSELEKRKVDSAGILNTELLCEESILKLAQNTVEGEKIGIRVQRYFAETCVRMSSRGDELHDLEDSGTIALAARELDSEDEEIDPGLLILKANEDRIRYYRNDGINQIRIRTKKDDKTHMYLTLLSLVLAIAVGFLFREYMPHTVNKTLCTYVFNPIKVMFINALKIVVGPVVFFSIVTCISQFTNLSELGKIGAKVMLMYTLTTLLAVSVGFGFYFIMNPGEWGIMQADMTEAAQVGAEANPQTSVLNTIMNIVPSNLLQPFLNSETLQIIFLAVLLGVAVGKIGSYSKVIKDLLEACNELFLTVTGMIAKLIPIVVFCAMFIMIVQTGTESMKAVVSLISTVLLALICMMLLYGMLILLFVRLNPLIFFRKNWEGMLNAFALSSSNAAMPLNIRIATEKMGISPKVSNFAIPLGATVNMDGTSLYFAIELLFLAKLYGVEVPRAALFSVLITILMLSLGTPGVPGASLVCLGILLCQVGVPVEAIGVVMGVDSLMDMFRTASNVTGDMAVSLIVAKSENVVDLDKYYS